jgi:hypothetical protein
VTLRTQTKLFFIYIFSYNLPVGTLASVLKLNLLPKICVKIVFSKQYFSPLNNFMGKGKDPDPYLSLIDPDPGGPKTCKYCRSGSPTLDNVAGNLQHVG